MAWEDEENYAKKREVEKEYSKKEEVQELKEEIAKLKIELNSYVKKAEFDQILYRNTENMWNYLLPHLNHRYCTNELFNKIRHDLNIKLKKLDYRWNDV